jgi:hypothetical protein
VVGILASLEFGGLGAGGIKRHTEVETLAVTGDGRIGPMRQAEIQGGGRKQRDRWFS